MVQQQVGALAQKTSIDAGLTVDVISDQRQFLELRGPWDRLVASSDVGHPYMSHSWLTEWWQSFGTGKELQIFVVKDGREWIAAAPMMIARKNMYGIPVHRLETLCNHHTPRYEFPIRDRNEYVYQALWHGMSNPRSIWDVVVLQQFMDSSPTLNAFDRMARLDGWRTGRWVGPPAPYVRLECDYDTLFNRLQTRERYHLRKRHSKLAAIGTVDMEIVTSRDEVAAAMEDGLRIEAAAWKGAAGTAMLSDPVVRDFYLKFAERAADNGFLRLAFLRVDGKRIAFLYMLDSDAVIHAMKVGYDPEYHSYSPGHILLTFVLRQACRDGRKELDFQGIKERWKLVWTSETRTYPWLFMFRDGFRGWLLHQAKFVLLPAWRKRSN